MADSLLGSFAHEVVVRLEMDPELRRRAEGASKQPSRDPLTSWPPVWSLGSDTPLPPDQLVDALDGNVEVFGKGTLAYSQPLQEILEKDLAGVGWDSILGQLLYSSVVIVDLHLVGNDREHGFGGSCIHADPP